MAKKSTLQYEIKISRRWSADRSEARSQIRLALLKLTRDPNVLNPSNYHRSKEGYFSISHTRGMGGFILSNKPSGFDIESHSRKISDRAYKRITTPIERDLGFTALEAWVAKEAAFKALSIRYKIKTITEIDLIARKKNTHGSNIEFSFNHRGSSSLRRSGKGHVRAHTRFLLGIASLSS